MGALCTHTMKRVQQRRFANFFLHSVKIQIVKG
jgi:hypothetical protein